MGRNREKVSRGWDRLWNKPTNSVSGVASPSSSSTPRPSSPISTTQLAVIPPSRPSSIIQQITTTVQNPATIPTTPIVTHDSALQEAIDKYLARIPEKDKAAFRSAGDIMDQIKMIDNTHSQSSISRSFGDRIQDVLGCMKGFLGSVAICIQHSPEISSLVIGGINCVLQLALGYIEFFEKLTRMMERVGGHLSYLSKYASKVFQDSPDVKKALIAAYCDLLDFFVAVRGVFTNSEGNHSRLTSFKIFFGVTWQPFESQFQGIQDRFLDHIDVVIREASVQGRITKDEKSRREKEIKEEQLKLEKCRSVLGWLSPVDFEEVHQINFSKRFGDTGQWFVEEDKFREWKAATQSSLLWYHGIPGAGKTTLLSFVLETLAAEHQLSSDTGIAFAYCNYKKQQTAATYIQVFIKQLCRLRKDVPTELEALYDKHTFNASTPSITEIQEAFSAVLECFKKVFILLDALDECTIDTRQELSQFFQRIISTTSCTDIKLLVASRKEPDIVRGFKDFPPIEIEAKKVAPDIDAYIVAQLEEFISDGRLILRDPTLKQEISDKLSSKAGGMFLWVDFQLKDILYQTSDRDIRKTLDRLPENMYETYERILLSIHKQPKSQRELARKVLMWVKHAKRPMTIGELMEAVAMESDTKSLSELMSSMVNNHEALVDACGNLVVADGPPETTAHELKLRFVHYSVQEYFEAPEISSLENRSIVEIYNTESQHAHTEMARFCITYLMRCWEVYMDEHMYGALLFYAEPTWKDHVRILSKIDEELLRLVLEFFKYGCGFGRIFQLEFGLVTCVCGERAAASHCTYDIQAKLSPSTAALVFDLPNIFDHLAKGNNNNLPHAEGTYALHYAAKNNSCQAAELLLGMGFEVDVLDSDGCAPLHYASGIEVAALLLDKGADVNAKNRSERTVLSTAASSGYNQVVMLLLDRGVDINAQDSDNRSALWYAAKLGSKEVVRLLLERGASVDTKDRYDITPLHMAANKGHKEIAQFLLDKSADVNARDEYGQSVLFCAVFYEREELVRLLLQQGAHVGGDELWAAKNSEGSHARREEMVQLLHHYSK